MEAGRSRKSPHRTPPASRTLTRRRSQQPSSSSWSHLAGAGGSAVAGFYTRGPAALCVHAAQGDTSTTGSPRCPGNVPSPWPASPAAAPPSCPADPSDLPRQPARVALWKNTHLILAHAQRILACSLGPIIPRPSTGRFAKPPSTDHKNPARSSSTCPCETARTKAWAAYILHSLPVA